MLRFMLKFLLRKPHVDATTESARVVLITKLNDRETYRKHKLFLVQLTNFYIQKNKFTPIQNQALRRLTNG